MKGLTKTQSAEDLQSRRVAAGTVLVAGAAATLMLGLTWTLPVLSIPPQTPVRLAESIVMVADIRRQAPDVTPLERHVVDESPVSVPVPPPVTPPAPLPVPKVEPPEVKPIVKPIVKPEKAPDPVIEPPPVVKPKPKVKTPPKVRPKPKPVTKPAPKPAEPVRSVTPAVTPAVPVKETPASAAPVAPSTTESAAEATALNQTVSELVAIVNAHKFYPRRARQIGAEGVVVLRVAVDADGRVTDVEIQDGHRSSHLNRAALKAGKALLGHRTALRRALNVRIPVRFALSDR